MSLMSSNIFSDNHLASSDACKARSAFFLMEANFAPGTIIRPRYAVTQNQKPNGANAISKIKRGYTHHPILYAVILIYLHKRRMGPPARNAYPLRSKGQLSLTSEASHSSSLKNENILRIRFSSHDSRSVSRNSVCRGDTPL